MPKLLPSLLLLPTPPSPITSASLSAAYRPSITATVTALKGLNTSTELIVVLPCPTLHGRLHEPRSHVYDEVQKLVGRIYSLICVVCAKIGVDVESDLPGSIDARVLLLDYNSSQTISQDQGSTLANFIAGPIIDLPTLAITRRRWNTIFSVDGEDGQKLLSTYLDIANRISPPLKVHLKSVSGGVSMIQREAIPRSATVSSKVHHVVAVGGTFDNIHAGHKLLLTATALLLQPVRNASSSPRRLIVGITGDELLKNKKYAEYLKSWKQRQDDVIEFLLSVLSFTRSQPEEEIRTLSFDQPVPNGKAIHTHLKSCLITIECVEIQDPFGPTITDESVTALVVSGETRSGGKAVNDKRLEKGWNTLEVFEIDVLDAGESDEGAIKTDDFASKISSTAIRKRKAENPRTSSL
jgi:phosphopantetheine adenylyltransferase